MSVMERLTDLLDRLASDPAFAKVKNRLNALADPGRLIGRAPAQVDEFLRNEVQPVLRKFRDEIPQSAEIRV